MSDEYFEGDNEPEVNADDEEYCDENISREGDQQIEDEEKEALENKDPNEEEKMEEEEDIDNMEILDTQVPDRNLKKKCNPEDRITPKFMTKYERARIIGTRALQISKNSPIYVALGTGFI